MNGFLVAAGIYLLIGTAFSYFIVSPIIKFRTDPEKDIPDFFRDPDNIFKAAVGGALFWPYYLPKQMHEWMFGYIVRRIWRSFLDFLSIVFLLLPSMFIVRYSEKLGDHLVRVIKNQQENHCKDCGLPRNWREENKAWEKREARRKWKNHY